jgi:GTP 3',8-cyclase
MTSVVDQLQRQLRDVRISVMDRCNFRCPYCMPEDRFPKDHAFLNQQARMSFAEIEKLARVLHQLGMRKLRITGGEPLLRKDLPALISTLKTLPDLEIAVTTNASLLTDQAAALKLAGLDRLTISLDSLEAQTFAMMSGGRGQLATVLEGIAAAEAAGFTSIKFNCVVQAGKNEPDVLALASHFRHSAHVVRFIEYMDVGSCNDWHRQDVIDAATMRDWIHARYPIEPVERHHSSDVAVLYRYLDGAGQIGFISSISQPFCRSCTRARVAADGKMYTCLFAASGHNLLPVLRTGTDTELLGLIRAIWSARHDRYSELRALKAPKGDDALIASSNKRVEMFHIGG